MKAVTVVRNEYIMRRLYNGVVDVCDIFEVHRSIELDTLVEGYLGAYRVVATHGYD